MGRGLVGEELAAGQPVLAEEEAVVGGEDDVGVAAAGRRAERVDDLLDAVVDRAQRLELLLPVDAVGVLFGRARGAAASRMKRGLSLTLPSSKPFGAVVRAAARRGTSRSGGAPAPARRGGGSRRAGRCSRAAGRRAGPAGVARISSRRMRVEDVGLVEAGQPVGRRERAAEVVAVAVFARFPAARSRRRGPSIVAVVVQRVAVVVVVRCRR